MTEILSSIDPGTWVLFVCFWTLLLATLSKQAGRVLITQKKGESWFLDTLCLLVQGAAIPLLQVMVVAAWLTYLFPEGGNQLQLHPLAAFALCFVGIDYLYYWNHRILHLSKLWPIHLVHHTADQMDVLTTSRNTLWSSLFIVYLWLNGAMLYFLADPAAYVGAITATAALDLWRHSPIHPTGALRKLLGSVLILPQDHAWHHSQDVYDVNFGANINFWDKLHGTWHASEASPQELGVKTDLSLPAKLLWPF